MLIRHKRILRSLLFRSAQRTAVSILLMTGLCFVVLGFFWQRKLADEGHSQTSAIGNDDETDVALERVAREALGSEDGTIIVMDAQTGRLRAVVNPQIAFTESYAPGSAIKPFTALAALRLNLIDEHTRQLCHTRYAYKDLSISCPHQKTDSAFNLTEALGYSCNYFFGKVGERLDTNSFDETLSSFGFGAQTGVGGASAEATGTLPQGEWRVSNALGESKQLMVTPVQMITAYAALVNGGHLFVPQQAEPGNFQTKERARLTVAPEHRALLIEGMKGVIRYGTASGAGLYALPFEVFGKTGTSAMMNDYHSQGWFIGFASESGSGEIIAPEKIKLAVLVFMKHASGAQCARVSRSIFEEYAKRREVGKDEKVTGELDSLSKSYASLPSAPVRIHLTSQNITRDIPLEEYVLGVVSAEGSLEDELEALKALAVVSRTYALHNLQRHASEGYDFCDTTHCQRYSLALTNERNQARFKNLFERAVNETAGETLRDEQGQIADVYFHAACGGMTANMETLWGTPAPSYLTGVTDEYCIGAAAHEWVNVIPLEKLLKALQGDSRSNCGARLESITITSRDRTGRVEFLSLEGETTRVVRGWDFKMIVGRSLGWNVIKSSRFDVVRSGTNFLFRGTGFGHGLGLCQQGAHALSRRGATYLQILSHYFPGTSIISNVRSAHPSDKGT